MHPVGSHISYKPSTGKQTLIERVARDTSACLSMCLWQVLCCWFCCELLKRPNVLKAWSLSCVLPFLALQFFSCLTFQRLRETLAPGRKSNTTWLIVPHKELQHLKVLLQSGVESICYNLVHSNKYFTFLIWNRNTCCKTTQPQMKYVLMWMYTSP